MPKQPATASCFFEVFCFISGIPGNSIIHVCFSIRMFNSKSSSNRCPGKIRLVYSGALLRQPATVHPGHRTPWGTAR